MIQVHNYLYCLVTFFTLLSITGATSAGEIKRRADAPKPLSPSASQKAFRVADGFEVQLVAAEPLIVDPLSIAFDARGRLFVSEFHGYNMEGHLEAVELNKTGKLDKTIRRVHASDETMKRVAKAMYSTIKMLEDTNGDGRMDKMTLWADHLPLCYGIVAAKNGVIAICAPDIIHFADKNNDGKMDSKQILFTGFSQGEIWSRVNHPRRGIDNWIYVATGMYNSGKVTGKNMQGTVTLGQTSFRFKENGSALEVTSGATSGFGLTMNYWGDRLLVSNQRHAYQVAPLPNRYLARNPHVITPNPMINICSYGHPCKVFPISKPHPWRLERSKQPEWMKFYGAAETNIGQMTSACSPLIYQGDQFPSQYLGNHFSCEPSQNLVHRCLLKRDGLSYSAVRVDKDEKTEFLASTDQWFRPINLIEAPDGSMYVADMYREIIEDHSAIPRYLQQQYGLIEGEKHGRIWRVVSTKKKHRNSVDLTKLLTEQLVQLLGSNNRWHRLTAQQILLTRKDPAALKPLRKLLRETKNGVTQLHLLYTLKGLGGLTVQHVMSALNNQHFAIRMHGLQLAERWIDDSHHKDLFDKICTLCDDPEPRVRLQLAFTLGESHDKRVASQLLKLAKRDGDELYVQTAILSSASKCGGNC